MKVIARAGVYTYLVEATTQELAALANREITVKERDPEGYSSSTRDSLKIGTTFNISAAWQQIHRNDRRKGEVHIIRKNLEAMLAMLDMTEPFVEEPAPEPEPEGAVQQ